MTNLLPLLHAVTYGDSAYPSGRYTLSHGLEGLVQAGQVSGLQQATDALASHLRFTAAPGDGVATALSVLIAERVARDPSKSQTAEEFLGHLDHELSAIKLTEEFRRSSTRVGRQTLSVHGAVFKESGLLKTFSETVSRRETPGNQAISLGLIHQSRGLSAEEAVSVELLGLAVGWSSAALRLRQCDHVGGQTMIAHVTALIAELSRAALRDAHELLDTGDFTLLGRASPGLDLASAAHERAPARLFMS